MPPLVTHLLANDDGQDLIEYALLTGFIGLTSLAALNLITAAVRTGYVTWDQGINGLWRPDPPASK